MQDLTNDTVLPFYGTGNVTDTNEASSVVPMRTSGNISGETHDFGRIEAQSDISAFYDTGKRYPIPDKLKIAAHNGFLGKNDLNGEALRNLLQTHVNPENLTNTGITAFGAADDGGPGTLASQLEHAFNTPFKAYRNGSRDSNFFSEHYNNLLMEGLAPTEIRQRIEGEFISIPQRFDFVHHAKWFNADGYRY